MKCQIILAISVLVLASTKAAPSVIDIGEIEVIGNGEVDSEWGLTVEIDDETSESSPVDNGGAGPGKEGGENGKEGVPEKPGQDQPGRPGQSENKSDKSQESKENSKDSDESVKDKTQEDNSSDTNDSNQDSEEEDKSKNKKVSKDVLEQYIKDLINQTCTWLECNTSCKTDGSHGGYCKFGTKCTCY